MTEEKGVEVLESETETCDSDDSQDPNFDVLEETRSRLSSLCIKKKSRSSVCKEVGEDVVDDDADGIEMAAPELGANDQKNFEIVHKIIEVGQAEKLKVEQCKLYLRKHGLRLTGKKDILIHRIKEHLSIMNGEGEHKYPASSFVMNCKGDACTGDVVLFEQNVYEMYNIASRSASGPPCGTRVVAGRIVKESYGAAKQQHTFTIEVLWSKGVKPLPPLRPLLIKGRNLYRLKTMRQRWEDESQRQKILSEKHARGNEARSNKEVRLKEKEMRKALRESRASKKNMQNENQGKKRQTSPTQPMINSRNPTKQDLPNASIQLEAINLPVLLNPHTGVASQGVLGNRTSTSMVQNYQGASYKENNNSNILRSPNRGEPNGPFRKNMGSYPFSQIEGHKYDVRANFYHHQSPPTSKVQNHQGVSYKEDITCNVLRSPVRGEPNGPFRKNMGFYPSSQIEGHNYDGRANFYRHQSPSGSHSFQRGNNNGHLPRFHSHGQRQQLCRYYAQGKCHYGTNCKYLH